MTTARLRDMVGLAGSAGPPSPGCPAQHGQHHERRIRPARAPYSVGPTTLAATIVKPYVATFMPPSRGRCGPLRITTTYVALHVAHLAHPN